MAFTIRNVYTTADAVGSPSGRKEWRGRVADEIHSDQRSESEPAGLSGVRILDLGRYIAGPYCAAMLADQGAEVIRIEPPDGAPDRDVMPVGLAGRGALYLQVNRNKKSLTLDLSR